MSAPNAGSFAAPEHFLLDEVRLSKRIAIPIADPLRVFHLSMFGIDAREFIARMEPTFEALEWDRCDLQLYGLQPFRRRAIARFVTEVSADGRWRIERVPADEFRMRVSDCRATARRFAEMSSAVTDDAQFQRLLRGIAELVRSFRPNTRRMTLTAHQISIVAAGGAGVSNSPEGIHQDGADFIVSALVVSRSGINGGVSRIYGPDRRTRYLNLLLKPEQGIFHADAGSTLYHDVSPIVRTRAAVEGVRNIFGFDCSIEQD